MFFRPIRPPEVSIHGTTIRINSTICTRALDKLVASRGRELGAAHDAKDGEALVRTLDGILADLDGCEALVAATVELRDVCALGVAALERGELPGGVYADLALAAADAHALIAKGREDAPTAVLPTERADEVLTKLKAAYDRLSAACAAAEPKLAKAARLRDRCAKVAFVYADPKALASRRLDRLLPADWQEAVGKGGAAATIRKRLQKLFADEEAAQVKIREEARGRIERAELQSELEEIHRG